jgi:hypothetical protein
MSLIQGQLGDCWVVSALACVAEKQGEISNRCKQQTLSSDGRYEITLFHPVQDRWMVIVIDDRLPVRDDERPGVSGEPCDPEYMNFSREAEIWGALYEKAFAKMMGGWDAIGSGGHPAVAIKAFTGIRNHLIKTWAKAGICACLGRWVCMEVRDSSDNN